MRLTFLGTSAAEGYPDPFCDCSNCDMARDQGGASLRKRSAALINDDLLLDFGPDVVAAAQMHGVSLTRVRYCLLTHEHADHLDTFNFSARLDACGPSGIPCLDFYATAGALRVASARLDSRLPPSGLLDPQVAERFHVTAHRVAPFESFDVGPYWVSSFLANHGSGKIVPLVYVVEQDGRRLLYCTDTGPLPDETLRALARLPGPLHVVAMDHTCGLKPTMPGHLNLALFVEQIARLRRDGIVADDTRVFAHHLGHHSNPSHSELVEHVARYGYDVAFDGLSLVV
jgi:phosphoribosyl 1,2-cyclic phosphate phosphodiesterase